MNMPRFSPALFLAAFCCVYILVFELNRPMFLYYPLHHHWVWGSTPLENAGPPMAWYGLMASAGLAAFLVAVIVPARYVEPVLHNRLWLFPVSAMGACGFLLRHFFQ